MKVITVCGSLRFEEIMKKYAEKLGLEGNCILSVIYPTKNKDEYTDEEIHNLEMGHYKKIELSDAIFVINKNGYIGEAVKKEIEYAKKCNKEIMYLENEIEINENKEIEKISYNKLVRDKIINIIENKGNKATYNILDNNEFAKELNKKLIEEINEFMKNNEAEELADVFEVIYKIIEIKNMDKNEVEKIRIKKQKERGGFENRIYLKDVIK
jgi:predicted house-cleaning noncanonical NTP pyrophosphatase (MazG superfamily)